jgi:hypothetical protein
MTMAICLYKYYFNHVTDLKWPRDEHTPTLIISDRQNQSLIICGAGRTDYLYVSKIIFKLSNNKKLVFLLSFTDGYLMRINFINKSYRSEQTLVVKSSNNNNLSPGQRTI